MKDSAKQLELEHKKQMAEALENLQSMQEAHKKEIHEIEEKAKLQSWVSFDERYNVSFLDWILFASSATSNWVDGEDHTREEYGSKAASKTKCRPREGQAHWSGQVEIGGDINWS